MDGTSRGLNFSKAIATACSVAAALAIGLGGTRPAAAADTFIFKVPYVLSNMHKWVRGWRVSCIVGPRSSVTTQAAVGSGFTAFKWDQRKARYGTATVKLVLPRNKAKLAKFYKCWLGIKGPGGYQSATRRGYLWATGVGKKDNYSVYGKVP
jgi:hypothetical protein